MGEGGGGWRGRGGVVIAWRETCAEREVSGQHSPRGRPFPRLSARLSAYRGDSPAPVRPNTHRGTCLLVRGFHRAKTLTMQPVRLCGYIGPNTHTHTDQRTCPLLWLYRAKHSQRNLSACVVTSSQTLTEEPVCLCGYFGQHTNIEEPDTHLLSFKKKKKKKKNVFLYGYTEPNVHKGTCPLVWLHRAKHSLHPYAPAVGVFFIIVFYCRFVCLHRARQYVQDI